MRLLVFIFLLIGFGQISTAYAENKSCSVAFKDTSLASYAVQIDQGKGLIFPDKKLTSQLNSVGGEGVSLLLCSLMERNKEAFDSLLSNGADVNLPIRLGYTIVHYASQIEDSYFLKRVLEVGGNPNQYNTRQMWKPTPLYFAASGDVQENVDLLLEAGANLNEKDVMGETAIVAAANLNNFKLAYYLAVKGADLKIVNKQDFTILEIIETTAAR